MMEGESSSSCFICGLSFVVKESPLMKRCDSFKDLRELLLRLCGLLSVEVTPEEWEGVDGDFLMKQTISCDKCFEILKNVERVHELLLKTQRELKQYLDEVESLIFRSDTPNYQCAFWRSSCFKLRRTVLEKVFPAINVGASVNSLGIQIKEESYDPQSAHPTFLEDQNVDDNFNHHWDASSPPPLGLPTPGLKDEAHVREFIQTPFTTTDNASLQLNSLLTTRKTRKRKITVIAEEDEVPQVSENSSSIFNPPTPESRQTRGAKKIAEAALQLYASSGEASDNDENYNHPSPQMDSGDDNASDASEDEEDTKPYSETDLEKGRKRKKKTGVEKQWWSFLIAQENLYLYRNTYVQNTFTHLKCLAYQCHFQTEWEYYPSFLKMRAHVEENHWNKITPHSSTETLHPCILCHTTHKTEEDFMDHLKHSHADLLGPKAKSICEACTRICVEGSVQSHVFTHKNMEEQAAALAAGKVPPMIVWNMGLKVERKMAKKAPPKVYQEGQDSQPPTLETKDLLKPEVLELVKKPIPKSITIRKEGQRKNNRMKIDNNQLRLFIFIKENLYIYRWETFVLYTRSHLECQAFKCGFKTEFDFYPSFQRMRAHIEENHRSRKHRQQTPHPCVLCQTTYQNREEFSKHFTKEHSQFNSPSQAVCECCLRIYRASGNILVHMFTHKNEAEKAEAISKNLAPTKCLPRKNELTTEKRYVCDYENCTYATNDSANIGRHKRSHLPKEQRSDYTICPECGVQILRERLKSHMQLVHHPETIDRFLECETCGKRYMYGHRRKFETHLMKHTGERPYLCQQCGKSWNDQARFNFHVKHAHLPRTQEWPCEWCDMVYTNKGTLYVHLRRKHPDKWKPKTQTRKMSKLYYDQKEEVKGVVYGPKQMFPCAICDLVCATKQTMGNHMFTIHGVGELKKKPHLSRDFYRRKKKVEDGGYGEDESGS